VKVAPELSGEDSAEEDVDATAPAAATAVAAAPAAKAKERDVLSQEAVEKWCKDAKEKDSLAALERLMKVLQNLEPKPFLECRSKRRQSKPQVDREDFVCQTHPSPAPNMYPSSSSPAPRNAGSPPPLSFPFPCQSSGAVLVHNFGMESGGPGEAGRGIRWLLGQRAGSPCSSMLH